MHTNLIAALAFACVSSSAFADVHCTNAPRAKWLAPADVKARVEQKGYNVQRIEADDGCYEVHATRKNGDRVKIKLHPITAAVVEEDIQSAQPAAAPTSVGPIAPVVR